MGVLKKMEEKQLERWKEIIRKTEDFVDQWIDENEKSPYFNQVCKSWENFIDKQKEELTYHMKRVGSSLDKKK